MHRHGIDRARGFGAAPPPRADSATSRLESGDRSRWRGATTWRCVELPLVASGDRVFVTTTDRKVRHDLATGRAGKRRFKTDLPTAPAVLEAEGQLRGNGPRRTALPASGSAGTRSPRSPCGQRRRGLKLPSLPRATQLEAEGTSLFLLDLAGNLQRIDPVDGSPEWEREGLGWDSPGFLLDGDLIFALARKDSLVAIDRETGKTRFGSYVPGFFAAAPRLDGGQVLVVSTEGRIYSVETRDGTVHDIGHHRIMQLVPPLAFEDRVVTVSADGWVEASVGNPLAAGRRADTALWASDLGEAVYGPPTAVSGLCFVPTSAGRLVALRADNGAQVWSLELSDRLAAAPLFTERFLVVATNRGDVYAYKH
ncbi:MAG: PQQ-binding-like beta-propeller repeat protein [Candidatus Eisenbacteria bacterium]